jgi:transposase, IS6 family
MRNSAKRFFSKALTAPHISTPCAIAGDKNAAYPKAFKELKAEEIMPALCELRQSKYLNNVIEQDHRFMKRLVKLGMGFFLFETAWRTLHVFEMMNMIRKGQLHSVGKGNILNQEMFIASLFGVAS